MKVTDAQLEEIVARCYSVYEVLRELGLKEAGGSHSHYSKRMQRLGICTEHFTGQAHAKGTASKQRKEASAILILRETGSRSKSHHLVRALIESEVKHECSKCGQGPEWMGNPLTLDVDHINENWLDDRLENLRFLCPNCHSQFSRRLLGH